MPVKIHVNQHVIRANLKNNETNPPLTIIRGRKKTRHTSVDIIGKATVVYSPDKPLSCGARVYIVADDAIGNEVFDPIAAKAVS